ncbi:MAG: TrkH family potassium uptake protein [Planctomycetota bacterium]
MRRDATLYKRYSEILSYTGVIFLVLGFVLLTPLLALTAWPAERTHVWGFIFPAGVLFLGGLALWRFFRPVGPSILTLQEGGVVVLLSWIAACLFSAWPFMAVQGLNFTQAVFESVSGWTTTGLSVVDVTKAPHIILLWRSIMQLLGGAGLAIVMLAAIAGPVGSGFSAAEGRTDQLAPHVRKSAKLVMTIYSGYAILGIIAYRIAGMTWFDAVNHAFPAVSTGGFSTYPDSIGHWDSVAIEAVTIPLMILGNLNFLTAFLLLHGKFSAVSRNGEVRLMASLIPMGALILFFFVCRGMYPLFGKAVRVAIFESVTALTTTGFSTVGYTDWNGIGFLVLIVLMLIGGGTCSTAGGIKQYRIYLMFRSILWEVRRLLLPRTVVMENYVWQGERKDFIGDDRIRQVSVYLFLYLVLYVLGTGVIAAHGYSLRDALFEFASAQGTVGLSIGVTAAAAPPLVLWTEAFGMFLGRLEFFIIFAALWKLLRDSRTLLS